MVVLALVLPCPISSLYRVHATLWWLYQDGSTICSYNNVINKTEVGNKTAASDDDTTFIVKPRLHDRTSCIQLCRAA